MKIFDAIEAVMDGQSVISPEGRFFGPADFEPEQIGTHCVIYKDVGLTKAEYKGEWYLE